MDVSGIATNLRTPYNYTEEKGEELPSQMDDMTIPDQSMTINEILERFARGMSVDDGRVPLYFGDEDEDLIDPERLDLSERMELQQRIREELSEIQERRSPKPEPVDPGPPAGEGGPVN